MARLTLIGIPASFSCRWQGWSSSWLVLERNTEDSRSGLYQVRACGVIRPLWERSIPWASAHVAANKPDEDRRAPSDAAIGDLREMAELNAQRIGEAIVLRQLALVKQFDAVAGEFQRVERPGITCGHRRVDLGGGDAQPRGVELQPVELTHVLDGLYLQLVKPEE